METRIWKDFDFFLLGSIILLLSLSILSVYSATLNAMTAYGTPLSVLFPRHIVNIVVGLVAMILVTFIDYRLLSGLATPFYVIAVVVLLTVLIVGKISEGAKSWIDMGVRTVQPAEVVKLMIIVVLASYWSHFAERRSEWLIQGGALLLTALPLLLTFIQPDFGTATVFAMIWLCMAWGAGMRWTQLLLLIAIVLPLAIIAWEVVLDQYQHARLSTFYWLLTDPSEADPNEAYNVVQSMNAIGSGGLLGAGLTQGLLSQGNYIPVQYTDFIFAVIGEEMGFIGSLVLITFQGVLLWLTLTIAQRARDTFGQLIAIGIFGMLLAHTLINIGMAMSILPVTGLPLPFISYGGTFTVVCLIAIGMLQSITLRWRRIDFEG